MTWCRSLSGRERMADQSRQVKLAAAKKKLKEFQQKSGPPPSSVGPKKKRKVKTGNQLDTSTPDRHSPDNIDSFLKVMSITNGVSLPPFISGQVSRLLFLSSPISLSLSLFSLCLTLFLVSLSLSFSISVP
ncbi:hypothetical protein AALO_G00305490, partial [Alosa alosa]